MPLKNVHFVDSRAGKSKPTTPQKTVGPLVSAPSPRSAPKEPKGPDAGGATAQKTAGALFAALAPRSAPKELKGPESSTSLVSTGLRQLQKAVSKVFRIFLSSFCFILLHLSFRLSSFPSFSFSLSFFYRIFSLFFISLLTPSFLFFNRPFFFSCLFPSRNSRKKKDDEGQTEVERKKRKQETRQKKEERRMTKEERREKKKRKKERTNEKDER